MDPTDFQRVEQELQQHVQALSPLQSKGLQNAQAWSSAPLGKLFTKYSFFLIFFFNIAKVFIMLFILPDESDDEFLPMKTRNSNLSDSVMSSATSMDASFSSSVSGATSSYSGKDVLSRLAGSPHRPPGSSNRSKRKHKGTPQAHMTAVSMH